MKETIISIIGGYEPVLDSAGEVVSGMAGVDWPWIAGAVLLVAGMVAAFAIVVSFGRRL